ncbi:MAG: tRNA preQ1(34) S-adenosylmethionine ribosyltransferase-isomerase QueA [Cystobacterineae bacterium]|nr:tRNA preQ1(34) S-adenosylmethionine ribosyltransferase-isomerase QueA [Cystobacterineae bacterium]
MDTQDFYFELPPGQIAQHPPARREEARLFCLCRGQRPLHRRIGALAEYARPGDVWVFNDTKVVKARLWGRKASTGGRVELLVTEPLEGGLSMGEGLGRPLAGQAWRCMGRSSKGFRVGERLLLGEGEGKGEGLRAEIHSLEEGGFIGVVFEGEGSMGGVLERWGHTPLPPYIRRRATPEDSRRYQTTYAQAEGSIAAPTAGLHFTPALMEALRGAGARLAFVRLDVGLGTFMPLRGPRIEAHPMHEEACFVSEEAAGVVNEALEGGKRVIAVGTTVVRCLEGCSEGGRLEAGHRRTGIFIYPGYRFRVVGGLLTNFHLPCSTLLMLVAAFWGREEILEAYREAVAEGYRFYSYGDAMWLEGGGALAGSF